MLPLPHSHRAVASRKYRPTLILRARYMIVLLRWKSQTPQLEKINVWAPGSGLRRLSPRQAYFLCAERLNKTLSFPSLPLFSSPTTPVPTFLHLANRALFLRSFPFLVFYTAPSPLPRKRGSRNRGGFSMANDNMEVDAAEAKLQTMAHSEQHYFKRLVLSCSPRSAPFMGARGTRC